MDKAALESKKLLGTYAQCSQNPTLLRYYCLLFGGNYWKGVENWKIDLRNITNFRHLATG
jgi:hypothetical protein